MSSIDVQIICLFNPRWIPAANPRSNFPVRATDIPKLQKNPKLSWAESAN